VGRRAWEGYLRLGGLSVCSEEEAIAEVSELVVGEEEDA
jgi:hypothetical protein